MKRITPQDAASFARFVRAMLKRQNDIIRETGDLAMEGFREDMRELLDEYAPETNPISKTFYAFWETL